MNSIVFVSNIIQGCVWLFCALVLLMIKTIPHPYDKSYRLAKRYLAFFCLTAFGAYAASFTVGELSGDRLEIFGIYNIVSLYIINVFVFLALLSLINCKKLITHKLFITRIPFVILLVAYCVVSVLYGETQVYSTKEYLENILKSPTLILKTLMLITVAVQFRLNITTYSNTYKNYVNTLHNYFSDNAHVLPKWIEHMLIVTRIIAVVVIVSVMIASELYDVIYSIVLTFAGIYYTMKFGNYQNYFHTALPAVEFEELSRDQYKTEDLLDDNEKVAQYEEEIEGLLSVWAGQADKPFLKCSITLGEVSQMTGITQRKLSKHINRQYGMTFNSWINSLKIEEVKRLLEHKKNNVTLTEIADQSGFTDLASMSNTFKKTTGISPSKYLKIIK